MKEYTITVGEVFTDEKAKELEEYLRAKDNDCFFWKTKYQNSSQLMSATVWHLNNVKDGEPTTKMGIPNLVYEVVEKKLSRLPGDRRIEEDEALEIARKK